MSSGPVSYAQPQRPQNAPCALAPSQPVGKSGIKEEHAEHREGWPGSSASYSHLETQGVKTFPRLLVPPRSSTQHGVRVPLSVHYKHQVAPAGGGWQPQQPPASRVSPGVARSYVSPSRVLRDNEVWSPMPVHQGDKPGLEPLRESRSELPSGHVLPLMELGSILCRKQCSGLRLPRPPLAPGKQ